MSQTQQKGAVSKDLPSAEPSAPEVQSEVVSWEPYLALMKSWQRADEICAKATNRAESTRKEEEERARSRFEADKAQLESARKERINALEAERRASKESADRLLAQVRTTQTRVRQAMETLGLETLMDNVEVPALPEREESATTLSSLRDIAADTVTLENSLQDNLFALRAARQRQSAQMWAVGIGLWLVAILVFAPYSWLTAVLVAVAVFVMGTPRKIDTSEALRPSFASHIGHCIALLTGKQQVMQHPFSLVEKGRSLSGSAVGGAVATVLIAWVLFIMIGPPVGFSLFEMLKHLAFVSAISGLAGFVTFAVTNQDITLAELNEGTKNKVLK